MIEIDMEHVKTMYMQGNEDRHLRNLDEILARLPEFILQQNVLASEQCWNRFCHEEAKRLGSRANIMDRFGIEEWHHCHKAREQAIWRQVEEAKERIALVDNPYLTRT